MSHPLRVLQIEDSESDAALIVRLLEKAGYSVQRQRVEDGPSLRRALEDHPWDVIIADYSLPQFGALAGLQIIKESGLDIPYLVVSASIGEDVAVAAMREGAHDYLLKDNLARLAPAVEREVREATARRERRRSEERLNLAIAATQLGTFDYYPHNGEWIWSDIARRQSGVAADAVVSFDTFLAAIHPEDRERVAASVADALQPASGHYAALYRTIGLGDGIERSLSAFGRTYFDSHARPIRLVGVTLDVTEHKRLEDQFRQAQKLESIGRLAGGVAHDFNNLLTIISGYAHMVRNEIVQEHPFHEPMDEIIRASERATELTRRLLIFSRKQVSQPKNILLNDLVRDMEKMLRRLISEDIEVAFHLDDHAGWLRADPVQVEQVLMNLVVNAKDAMPNGGKLVIESSHLLVDETFAHAHLSVQPGSYVMLTVSDTGTGMSAETKAHIFEPFFTTKEPGKGTGLGLATVYGIVKQSGGSIWVYSEPGHGATFKILFPEVTGDPEPVDAARPAVTLSGNETILLAEDEPGLRDLVRRVLTRQGYKLLEAANGKEALSIAGQHSGRIDLLLTDVVMPQMGGPELANKFGTRHPDVPVLFMSGYAEGLGMENDTPPGFIQKPFTSAGLLTRLRAELDRRPAAR